MLSSSSPSSRIAATTVACTDEICACVYFFIHILHAYEEAKVAYVCMCLCFCVSVTHSHCQTHTHVKQQVIVAVEAAALAATAIHVNVY